ncbi:MFS transporter [Actinokineospora auranticolor]|uniref:MFS transporter n=1 Tax=Actinokineospora auranticolor TaxID=155976 RepID=A0A2S6GK90_9PSEU|nr:MFS transporter [Actinokineospora auranticolor]PPK65654.1 MFS transporter [Actinokineospora auranticolor]
MFRRFVPPAGPSRGLALAQLTNSIGDGAYYVCSTLYFTRIVGLSPTQVGFGLTLGWALGTLAGVPLGHLADRRGPRGVAVLLAVATAVAVAGFALARSFPAFLVAACVYTVCQCGLVASRQALLAGVVDAAGRTKARAYLQSTANAGIAIGAAVGGVALQFDTEAAYLSAFALDALTFLGAALVLRRLPLVPGVERAGDGEPALGVLRDRPYAVITVLNSVMMLYMPLLSVVLPLWVVEHTAAPRWMVAGLMVVNTVTVVLFQVSVANRVTDLDSAVRMVRVSGVLLLAACAVFALSAGGLAAWAAVAVLLAGALLQAVGEMMLASGFWEVSFGLAPEGRHGQYQGFFGSGISVARTVGPLLLTALVIGGGAVGWLVLGGLFLLASLATAPAVAWARRTRPATV